MFSPERINNVQEAGLLTNELAVPDVACDLTRCSLPQTDSNRTVQEDLINQNRPHKEHKHCHRTSGTTLHNYADWGVVSLYIHPIVVCLEA